MIIKLPSYPSRNFTFNIGEVLKIVGDLNRCKPNEDIVFDLADCEFANPFVLTTIGILINDYREKGYNITANVDCKSQSFKDYLRYIHFYDGLNPEAIAGGNYGEKMDSYRRRTYIPLISFPVGNSKSEMDIRHRFQSVIGDVLSQQTQLPTNIRAALLYLIDEAIQNLVDHSKANRGFIFSQYYKKAGYMDLCIADCGISIFGSYQQHGFAGITDDATAILNAAKGVSTKNYDGGRGYGISTSKNAIVTGLGGNYSIVSGSAMLIATPDKSQIINIRDNGRWGGTIFALRIPTTANNGFTIYDYTE